MESKEHLSQLMDGEIEGDTGRFVLRRLEASMELRQTWARYHLIRDCLRRQEWGLAATGLSARVRRALEVPETHVNQPSTARKERNRWLRPAAGLAVAATVALMAIVTVAPDLSRSGSSTMSRANNETAKSFNSPNILSNGPATRPVSMSGASQTTGRSLNTYILRHYQVSGASGSNGFVSFVPIVAVNSAAETVPEPKPASKPGDSDESSD